MRLEAEEGSGVVLTELSACSSQLTEIAAQLRQMDTLIYRDAAGTAEQVALASATQQFCYPSFQRCDAVVEEVVCQFRFRAAQLRLGGPLFGTRQMKECATRLRETARLRGIGADRSPTQ